MANGKTFQVLAVPNMILIVSRQNYRSCKLQSISWLQVSRLLIKLDRQLKLKTLCGTEQPIEQYQLFFKRNL